MIKYRIYCDATKTQSDGSMPVVIIFESKGKRSKLSTGLRTSHKFTGNIFPSKERSARQKTAALAMILDKVDEIIMKQATMPFDVVIGSIKQHIGNGQNKAHKRVFSDYVRDYKETLSNNATKALYESTARMIDTYDASATFDTITPDWLKRFEANALQTMKINGLAIRLRNIRTVFNWAIDNEWTNNYPFRRYKIKQQAIVINNISVDELRMLRDYPVEEWQEKYRDFFMLSFYLCGINPGDLLLLKKSDMRNGRIHYTRQKTHKLYDIPVPKEAKAIINKYRSEKDWLLSFMDNKDDYHYFAKRCNEALKKIGTSRIVHDKVGKLRKIEYHPILPHITIYTARYTFASIGAELDIPRETIALCLGHSWADVTSRYISYDTKKIDDAVRKIIDYVNGK